MNPFNDTEREIVWKAWDESLYPHPFLLEITNLKVKEIAKKIYERTIEPFHNQREDRMAYCMGCETFLTLYDSMLIDTSHPRDKLLSMTDFVKLYDVHSEIDVYHWMLKNLNYVCTNTYPPIQYIKRPGMNRFHFTYIDPKEMKEIASTTELEKVLISFQLATKDTMLEKLLTYYEIAVEERDQFQALLASSNNSICQRSFDYSSLI